jgi:single-stranded-DNA-specific exonuclease
VDIEKCSEGSLLGDFRAQDARLKNLAGVGVMFYLLLALRANLRADGWFADSGVLEPDLSLLLDLVALGTVADLVALDYNNRVLVEAGLRRIRKGRACAGIAALFSSGKRDYAKASAADLGFVVAPRLNAAGRIDDISLGIECLLADDPARARALAERLSALNAERREMQSDMTAQAETTVHRWISQHGTE